MTAGRWNEPLAEVGYFKAKAYLLDEKKWQHWPKGSDLSILACILNFACTANTIYCAFTRLFGDTKKLPPRRMKNWRSLSNHSKPGVTPRCRPRENFAT